MVINSKRLLLVILQANVIPMEYGMAIFISNFSLAFQYFIIFGEGEEEGGIGYMRLNLNT